MANNPTISQAYAITVDYGLSLDKMIEAGNYNVVSSNINTEGYPVNGQGSVSKDIVLFQFAKATCSEDVIAAMALSGYRPADHIELLALGAQHPNLQRELPTLALGQAGCKNVMVLSCGTARGTGRSLRELGFEADFSPNNYFAAVKKAA